MNYLNAETLKQICDKLPGEYTVRLETSNGDVVNIGDTFAVDVSNGYLVLKQL